MSTLFDGASGYWDTLVNEQERYVSNKTYSTAYRMLDGLTMLYTLLICGRVIVVCSGVTYGNYINKKKSKWKLDRKFIRRLEASRTTATLRVPPTLELWLALFRVFGHSRTSLMILPISLGATHHIRV
ncbi:hypothetical protein OG21DRAFT_1544463 [Imleria badia]|nr:hypothetical protein OG21DRAFT_1544463 [Imleria badia]